MKGRLFGILGTLVLCLFLLPGTARAEETLEGGLNLVDKATEGAEDPEAGWKWEPDRGGGGTLTLSNCHLKGNVIGDDNKTLLPEVIWFPDSPDGTSEYRIVLEGDNVIESTNLSRFGGMISVHGAALGQFTITGNGSLTFLLPPGNTASNTPYAIAGSGSIVIEEGAAVRANVDLCVVNRDVILRGGSVTLEGEYVTYGIYTNAGDVIVESGDLTIDSSVAGIFLPGLPPTTRTNNVKISGGTVNINAPVSAVHINHQPDGGQTGEKIEITGGEVRLNGGSRAFYGEEITVGEDADLNVIVTNGPGLLVPEGRAVKLAAGTYSGNGTAIQITAADATLRDLLETGCAYYDESGALITEGLDGKTLSGTVTVKPCGHEGQIRPNEDGLTHGGTCAGCGEVFTGEPHAWDGTGDPVCGGCGADLAVRVAAGPQIRYLTALTSGVFASDSGNDGAVATLLRDVTLDEWLNIRIACRLDLGGHTLTLAAGSNATGMTLQMGAVMTIQDGSISGMGGDNQYTAIWACENLTLADVTLVSSGTGVCHTNNAGSLTLSGNTHITGTTGVSMGGASLTAESGVTLTATGTGEEDAALVGVGNFTCSLSPGCTLLGPTAVSTLDSAAVQPVYVRDLPDGTWCFADEDGKAIALEAEQQKLPGPVVVKLCEHEANVCDYEMTEGAETHSMTCRACGKTEAAESCAYEYEAVDETNHKGTCQCGREKTEAHALASEWSPDYHETTVTIVHACTAGCGYSVPDGTIQYPDDVRIVYGESCELEIIAGGLENAAVQWTDEETSVVSQENPYIRTDLNAGEHAFHFEVRWDGDGGSPLAGVVHVSVDRASLSGRPAFGSGQGKALQDVEVTLPADWPAGTFEWLYEEDPSQQVVRGKNYSYSFVSDDGNYEARGNVILWAAPPPPPPQEDLRSKLEVSEGFTEVPEGLKDVPGLNTPAKLEAAMRLNITQAGIPAGNTAVYDVTLLVSRDGGRTWAPATPANFPSGGLTVTLPYPEGTDRSYTFKVVHMFTTSAFGKTPGETESPAVTNTAEGLQFTVTGLSPISVGWTKPSSGESGDPPSDGGGSGGGSSSGGGGKHGSLYPPTPPAAKPEKACALGTACPSRRFADVRAGAWYHDAVDFVLENGLMNGYADGGFRPDGVLTRAQFAQILYNKEGRPAAAGGGFADVAPGAWCAPAVAWAAERGITGGYGNGLFGPNDGITREQLAVMLWRYAGSPAAGGELDFPDGDRAGDYAREALSWAVESGVMSGRSDGTLAPKGPATRAQAAQMLANFLQR